MKSFEKEISWKRLGMSLPVWLLLLSFPFLQACMSGTALRTDAAKGGDMQGSYTVIFYGGNFSDDLETVAFLDKEGDGYVIEPFAPDFAYKIKKGLPADEALHEADAFIRWHSAFHKEQFSSIMDEKGIIMGYELRPLYLPITYGTDDVLDINYRLQRDKVIAYVRLKPALEKTKQDFRREVKDK
jgi:hypothetical protein